MPPKPPDLDETWQPVSVRPPDLDATGAPTEDSFLHRTADVIIPTALNIGGAIVGGIAGTPLGPAGVVAGGALGAAAGETAAEAYQKYTGDRTAFNPYQIATQAALGAIPMGKIGGSVARVALGRAGQGAAMGGVGSVATDLAEGRTPSVRGVVTGMAAGTVLGGGMGAVEGRAAARAAAAVRPPVEVKPPTAVPEPTVSFTHYSAKPLTVLDPAFQGTGQPGAERARIKANPDVHTPQAYGYTNPAAVEARFKNLIPHEGLVPTSKVYDLTADPDGFLAAARQVEPTDNGRAYMLAQKNAHDAGYIASTIPGAEHPSTAGTISLLEPVPVTPVGKAIPPLESGRTTGSFVEGEGGLSDVAAGKREPLVTPPSEADLNTARAANGMGPVPEAKPIPAARLEEPTFFNKMDPEVSDGLKQIYKENVAQRRNVQPIARSKALAQGIEVNPDVPLAPGTAGNTETQMAYRMMQTNLEMDLKSLRTKALEGTASEADALDLVRKQRQLFTVVASEHGMRTETARAMRGMQEMTTVLESRDALSIQKLLRAAKQEGMDAVEIADIWSQLKTPAEQDAFLKNELKTRWSGKGIFYASILSGVKTHLRNIVGTATNLAWQTLIHPAIVAADVLNSAKTGAPREVFLSEIPARLYGAKAGFVQGLNDLVFTLKNGTGRVAMDSLTDTVRVELPGGGKNPLNWTGRGLEAEDQFFHGIAYQMELNTLLHASAKMEGRAQSLSGRKLSDFMTAKLAEWGTAPPAAIAKRAEALAQRQLFRGKPGAFAQMIMDAKRHQTIVLDPATGKPRLETGTRTLKIKDPKTGAVTERTVTYSKPMTRNYAGVLDFVVPFVKTPANIIRQALVDSTPLTAASSQNRAAFNAGGRYRAEIVGRAAAGTAALTALAFWASQGKLSGGGPTSPSARATLQEEGWKPFSVKIGDHWVDYMNMPLASAMAGVANAHEAYQENNKTLTELDIAKLFTVSLASSALDQSFLSSLSDLTNALSDPKRYGDQLIRGKAQSAVPFSGILRNVTQAVDPVVREPGSGMDTFKVILPGASKTVSAKLDRWGEPVVRQGGAFERGLAPITLGRPSTDAVTLTLQKMGVTTIGAPPKTIEAAQGVPGFVLSVEERQQIGRAQRRAAEEALQDGSVTKEELLSYVQRSREIAMQQIRAAHAAP